MLLFMLNLSPHAGDHSLFEGGIGLGVAVRFFE